MNTTLFFTNFQSYNLSISMGMIGNHYEIIGNLLKNIIRIWRFHKKMHYCPEKSGHRYS